MKQRGPTRQDWLWRGLLALPFLIALAWAGVLIGLLAVFTTLRAIAGG